MNAQYTYHKYKIKRYKLLRVEFRPLEADTQKVNRQYTQSVYNRFPGLEC